MNESLALLTLTVVLVRGRPTRRRGHIEQIQTQHLLVVPLVLVESSSTLGSEYYKTGAPPPEIHAIIPPDTDPEENPHAPVWGPWKVSAAIAASTAPIDYAEQEPWPTLPTAPRIISESLGYRYLDLRSWYDISDSQQHTSSRPWTAFTTGISSST
jgi:hypothetical protein